MTLIVSGTNRPNSNTLKLADYYSRILNSKGESSTILSLSDLPPDFLFSNTFGNKSEAFAPFQQLVNRAEKFIFIIPEYNGSFPGILKAFIDVCDFPDSFNGKKAALLGHSSGKYGNIRGVEHFTGICHYIGLNVMPVKLHISYIHKELNAEGQLTDPKTIAFCMDQIERFLGF